VNNILIIGDSCTDVFIYGICNRLNPEAPVPIMYETYRTQNPGMAGNVHQNLLHLGLEADFMTQKEEIIKTRFVEEKSNYILLRFDKDTKITSKNDVRSIPFESYDMVIVSDYNKGFLSEEDIRHILKRSKTSFVDTKKPIDEWVRNASFIKINEEEFGSIKNNKAFMLDELAKKVIITLGDQGAAYYGDYFRPPKEVVTRDVVGAGDTFLAALAGHYLLNRDIETAINFANLCAGQVVGKRGVAYPDEKLA